MVFTYKKEVTHIIGFHYHFKDIKPIGSVCVNQTKQECIIHSLLVCDDWRRKGIGKELMEEAERKIALHNYDYAYLYVLENSWMHEWYKRLGYEDTKEPSESRYVKMKKLLG